MLYQYQVVGTIILSVLNYEQLNELIDEDEGYYPSISSYAPCDGRSINGSTLARTIKIDKAPNLTDSKTREEDGYVIYSYIKIN